MAEAAVVTRGRAGKREAILDAGLLVLARDGYAAASMDAIAAAAGAAKPTVYNHFGDKAALFAAVVEHYSARSHAEIGAVVDALDVDAADLRVELERVARALLSCLGSASGRAVMRLEVTEGRRFPELLGRLRETGTRRTLDALAGKIAQLVLAGRLRAVDPRRAARQLFALVVDEPLRMSSFGEHEVPPDAVERAAVEGVDTFLAAFGAGAA